MQAETGFICSDWQVQKIDDFAESHKKNIVYLVGFTRWLKCNENDEPRQLIKMFSHRSIYGSGGMVIEALY